MRKGGGERGAAAGRSEPVRGEGAPSGQGPPERLRGLVGGGLGDKGWG